jgi:predicted regulator of Ras-like GTPase activity (Roadblock/LC7/MglB family)
MFRENLSRLVDSVEGSVAGLLMGFDGIAVESYWKDSGAGPGFDVETIAMEYSFILGQVRKAAEALDVGGVHELTIKAERLTTLIRVINQDYFVALAMTPDGNFGKGRYVMRVVAPKLQEELV